MKKYGILALSILLLLALAMPVVSAGSYDNMAVVANTTSDLNGDYTLTEIPNGNYTLIGINKSEDNTWRKAEVGISIANSDRFEYLNTSSRNIDATEMEYLVNLLNRSSVSGQTYKKVKDAPEEVHPYTTVLLFDSTTNELVANTTSSLTGHYTLIGIPNGDYTLIGINKSEDNTWRKAEVDISIANSDCFEYLNTSSRNIDATEMEYLMSLLNRSSVLGQTYKKVKDAPEEVHPYTTVLLFDSTTNELVANTTSSLTGHYTLTGIPNGDYTLIGINKSEDNTWRKAEVDISIANSDCFEYLNTSSRNIDATEMEYLMSLLNRSSVSGQTYKKVKDAPEEVHPYTTVLLLKEKLGANDHHLNISIITGYESYSAKLNSVVERINSNPDYNITVSYYLPSTIESDVNFTEMDIIYVNMFSDTASLITDNIDEAIANGTIVVGYNTLLNENYVVPESFSSEDKFEDELQDYWIYGAIDESNFDNLIFFLATTLGDRNDLQVEEPIGSDRAIYHPGMPAPHFTNNASEYFEWYSNRDPAEHSFDVDAPTIGMTFYASYYPDDMAAYDDIIEKLELRGMNVIACYSAKTEPSDPFFNYSPETKVDLILSSTYRSQYFDIDGLGVPVMNTVLNSYMNLTEWQEATNPLPNTNMLRIYRPESWGWIDPIMIASEEIDSQGNDIYVPVESQIDWLVDRAEAQTELALKDESEKKAVVVYYNHGAGKDNIGASYLEVIPSINNLLNAMDDAGYQVNESEIPNETELVDLFLTQGTNIGTWAPGKLEELVDTDKVELIPEETYNGWFDALPEERKQEVIDMWGEAPGEIMVHEDENGNKFIVIPKIEISENVILAPQPTRGWLQDNDAIYHAGELPPHHQYIAFYLWLQNEFDADVMINMGRHGTVEWLPGKEFGLFRDEWPAIMTGDIPVVYPYVMDGVGEGMQAKRRGNAIIIDHLIPPVVMSGSYGNYTTLNQKIGQYNTLSSDPSMQEARYKEIVNLTLELHLDERVDMSLSQDNATRDEFLDELDDVLRELRTTSMPYGLHILGTSPQDEQLNEMVCSMLGNDFKEEVALYNTSENASVSLLDLVLNQGIGSTDAQEQVLGVGNSSVKMDAYLSDSVEYANTLSQSENETQQVINAMDGKYIAANLGGDPILRPDTLPSGMNFYASDEQIIPTPHAWKLGMDLANETIDIYMAENNGEYPRKVAFVLWAGESTRHEGVMEAEILYLLGVKPVWDGTKVVDVELIDSSELGRPRIDVLVQISGLYRDSFPHKVELIDKAVYLAYNAPDNGYKEDEERPTPEYIPYDPAENTNYVRENTNNIYNGLNATFQNETASMTISLLRIFGPEDGAYGTGMANAISASDTWEDNTALADLYMERMSHAYGEYVWGESIEDIVSQWDVADSSVDNKEVFEDNLEDVEAILHSRSSNTYGALDTDDFFQYMGGLMLVVGEASGTTPDTYIMNLQNPDAETIETLKTYLSREIVTRYLNPSWIEGMQQHGFEGAGAMGDFIENLWGWEAVCPDLIDEHVWDSVYETYMTGENADWIKENNPYAYQSMNARMIETARKGNWDASDEVLKSLIKDYVESVAENGVTCCHHTCGNPSLDQFISGQISLLGVDVDRDTLEKYNELMQEATHRYPETSASSKSSSNTPSANIVNTTSTNTDTAGYGTATEQGSAVDDNYVEGYEMTKETTSEENASSSGFSGSDVIATAVVLVAVGTIIYGFRRQRL
ncbi:cobaltochelatase subunit CobN [Methanococcoides orientis]|uniref:cobaltochelatase subunit CobN n=1 Tax=Methanococcoides orientis TaxID=2822137 RepID=UPI001E5645F9|nr:cobaltochelatase subunit CobN [Methanococcoides orientis]UGV41342.1 cobaltochelatase subunit CobN [Methanococcoides orientis]